VVDARTALSCFALIGFELRRFAIEAHVRWMIADSGDELHSSFTNLGQFVVLSLARVQDSLVNAAAREYAGDLKDAVTRALRSYRVKWNDDARQKFVTERDAAEQEYLDGDWCEKQSPLHCPEWQSLIRACEDLKQNLPRPLAIAFQVGMTDCDAAYIDDSTPEGMPLLGTEAFPLARREQLLAELRDCLPNYCGDFFQANASLDLPPRLDGSRWAEGMLGLVATITESIPEGSGHQDASARSLPEATSGTAFEKTANNPAGEIPDGRTATAANRKRGSDSTPENSTTSQVAQQLGVDQGKVLDWIHSGQLVAVNVATNSGGRPRWRVSQESLAEFLTWCPPSSENKVGRYGILLSAKGQFHLDPFPPRASFSMEVERLESVWLNSISNDFGSACFNCGDSASVSRHLCQKRLMPLASSSILFSPSAISVGS